MSQIKRKLGFDRRCRNNGDSYFETGITIAINIYFFFFTECVFGKQIRELGSQWIPDLGVPIGVLYCMKCECVPVRTNIFINTYSLLLLLFLLLHQPRFTQCCKNASSKLWHSSRSLTTLIHCFPTTSLTSSIHLFQSSCLSACAS